MPSKRVAKKIKGPATESIIDAVRGRSKKTPGLEELVQHFFQIAGGPRTVAKLMYEEFLAGRIGGQTRTRILQAVMQATKLVGLNQKGGEDLSLVSDEDLERAILEIRGGAGEEEDDGGAAGGDQPAAPEEPAAGAARPAAPDVFGPGAGI